jgi:type I site-specific restriction-modification system R (restriction) subunit
MDSRLRRNDENKSGNDEKAKAWRIDLVLFVNGLPIATLELKQEFKQAAAYNLVQKIQGADQEVDSKKAKVKLNQWGQVNYYLTPAIMLHSKN